MADSNMQILPLILWKFIQTVNDQIGQEKNTLLQILNAFKWKIITALSLKCHRCAGWWGRRKLRSRHHLALLPWRVLVLARVFILAALKSLFPPNINWVLWGNALNDSNDPSQTFQAVWDDSLITTKTALNGREEGVKVPWRGLILESNYAGYTFLYPEWQSWLIGCFMVGWMETHRG